MFTGLKYFLPWKLIEQQLTSLIKSSSTNTITFICTSKVIRIINRTFIPFQKEKKNRTFIKLNNKAESSHKEKNNIHHGLDVEPVSYIKAFCPV